jgi:hypothetical protein
MTLLETCYCVNHTISFCSTESSASVELAGECGILFVKTSYLE